MHGEGTGGWGRGTLTIALKMINWISVCAKPSARVHRASQAMPPGTRGEEETANARGMFQLVCPPSPGDLDDRSPTKTGFFPHLSANTPARRRNPPNVSLERGGVGSNFNVDAHQRARAAITTFGRPATHVYALINHC
jgi:hypothetical protein